VRLVVSAALFLSTALAQSTITVTSSANPATFGDPVTLKVAVVSPLSSKRPTGTVSASILGLFGLGSITLDAAGQGSLLVPFTIGLSPRPPWGFAAGSNSVTLSYGGDDTFAATQTTFTQVVNKANSTTSASLLAAAAVGQSISATVRIAGSSATTPFEVPGDTAVPANPSGSVQFLRGGTLLGTATLAPSGSFQSTATLTATAIAPAGDIVAVYNGDANYNGSTSPPATLPNKTAAFVTVTSSANPASFAEPLTFSVAIASAVANSAIPTGAVQATLAGSYLLGGGTLDANGRASFTVPQDPGQLTYLPWGLATGSNIITVTYSGDVHYAPSQATFNQLVNKANTATSLVLAPVPPRAEFFTVTAMVRIDEAPVTKLAFGIPGGGNVSTSPLGIVDFFNGDTLIGTVPLLAGANFQSSANFTTGFVSSSIRAVYYGNTNYNGSSSPTTTPGGAAVNITLASSSNPVIYGAAFTVVATVKPAAAGGPTPTGIVSFYEGSRNLGWVSTLDSSGRGSMPIPAPLAAPALCPCPSAAPVMVLGAGSHAITVSYGGDANYAGTISPSALAQQIGKAPTTTTLAASLPPHIVANVADAQPPSGGPYHFMVMGAAGLEDGNPGGPVQFFDGSTLLGKASLTASALANVMSTAAFDTIGQSAGFSAVYSGDANFAGSASTTTVRTATSVKLTGSPNPSIANQTVTLTATISPAPTGTVDFFDGSALLGRVAVSNGVANITTAFSTAGPHFLSATYNGDDTYLPSTAALNQTVRPGTGPAGVLNLDAGPSTAVYGEQIVFTITVAGTGNVPPLGEVRLLDGSTVIGVGSLSLSSAHVIVTLPVGAHQISAAWDGDENWPPATSAVLVESVGRAQTVTTLAASGNGLLAAVTALRPGAGTPSGKVQFIDANSQTVLVTADLVNGSAQATLNTLIATTVIAAYSGDSNFQASTSNLWPAIVNAGNVLTASLAPEEIATIYGANLASSTAAATLPLTTSLGGASVTVTDSTGVSRPALLYYVSPGQINFVVPAGTAKGPAAVNVAGFVIGITVSPLVPSLFPAAQIVRVHADGTQSIENVSGSIVYGADSLYLVLYGSGIRNVASLDNVRCRIGNTDFAVTYAGAQSQYPGLDQVVIPLPASPKVAGVASVYVSAGGQTSNALQFTFQ
jgi:uncharacterized protein (TIGR03437 family)